MADELPDPPYGPDVDLKDFAFTPIYRARLFGSSFHARVNDAEWRAGVTLWLKSQDQMPAGTLPTDDVDLCRLAELGRDMRTWKKLRTGALHGWYRCSDGRLYHPVVAEVVQDQWLGKLRQKWRADCARVKKYCQRHNQKFEPPDFEEWLSQGQRCNVPGTDGESPEDNDPPSPGNGGDVPRENHSKGQGEGQGQGQGQGQGSKEEGGQSPPYRIPLKPEPTESVAPREVEVESGEDLNPEVRLAPPPQAPGRSALREKIKTQLRQKLMRYVNARMTGDEQRIATLGLIGEDANHDQQWWLDEINRRRKREGWDDTREWKLEHIGTVQ